tara:strand:- start:379 stop:681 length:303 start_codon:yes stop_codon:yes gene_type:complete
MTNAKEELKESFRYRELNLENLFDGAMIRYFPDDIDDDYTKTFQPNELDRFLNYLADINYFSGYGEQKLFGFVLLNDDTWFDRQEYDGREWWVLRKRPVL